MLPLLRSMVLMFTSFDSASSLRSRSSRRSFASRLPDSDTTMDEFSDAMSLSSEFAVVRSFVRPSRAEAAASFRCESIALNVVASAWPLARTAVRDTSLVGFVERSLHELQNLSSAADSDESDGSPKIDSTRVRMPDVVEYCPEFEALVRYCWSSSASRERVMPCTATPVPSYPYGKPCGVCAASRTV